MSYVDQFLNQCVSYGFEGGPTFNTQIVDIQSGREKRNAMWSQQKHKYSASFLNISKDEYKSIKQMHLVCMGRLRSFKFIDPMDNEAVNQVIGSGNGVQREFQFSTTSVIADVPYTRGIYGLILNEDFSVSINNVIQNPNTYIVDDLRGTILFNSAPANNSIVRWSGNFFVWVRFEQDDLPFSIDNINAMNGQINLIEVPPPAKIGS